MSSHVIELSGRRGRRSLAGEISLANLPWAQDRPHRLADFEGQKGRQIAKQLVDFAVVRAQIKNYQLFRGYFGVKR